MVKGCVGKLWVRDAQSPGFVGKEENVHTWQSSGPGTGLMEGGRGTRNFCSPWICVCVCDEGQRVRKRPMASFPADYPTFVKLQEGVMMEGDKAKNVVSKVNCGG